MKIIKRAGLFLFSCFLLAGTIFAQVTEGISKTFKLKVENRRELLEELQRENRIRETLWQKELEKMRQNLPENNKVSSNTQIYVKPKVVTNVTDDGSKETNLQLSFSYKTSVTAHALRTKVSNNTDDYPPGAYNAMSSNACMLTCDFIKQKTETELARYFIPGTRVTIKITGETDSTPIKSKIEYKGEYGDFYRKMIYLNNRITDMTVTRQSGISDNGQLAFLRTQGVEEFLKTYMDALQATDNSYQIYAIENERKGNQFRRISIELTIHGAFDKELAALDPPPESQIENNPSEIDTNIPVSEKKNPDSFALIIANENYNEPLPSVPFALNDGETFKTYCRNILGIPDRQIKLVKNATLNSMQEGVDWLLGVMKSWNGKAKIIVYYAGHGTPDAETNSAYLVPVDANPTRRNQLFGLKRLYSMLGKIPCQSVTYFWDACFSGTRRNGQMLVEDTRAIVVRPKEETLKGNSVVFSAADGYQTAHPFKEQKHGLFTYFLLKYLKESKGESTYGELFDQIKKDVSKEARLNSKEQTPTINTSGALINGWKEMKF